MPATRIVLVALLFAGMLAPIPAVAAKFSADIPLVGDSSGNVRAFFDSFTDLGRSDSPLHLEATLQLGVAADRGHVTTNAFDVVFSGSTQAVTGTIFATGEPFSILVEPLSFHFTPDFTIFPINLIGRINSSSRPGVFTVRESISFLGQSFVRVVQRSGEYRVDGQLSDLGDMLAFDGGITLSLYDRIDAAFEPAGQLDVSLGYSWQVAGKGPKAAVPEPSSIALVGTGAALLGALRRAHRIPRPSSQT